MKRIFGLLACLLSISLLAACTTQGQSYCPPTSDDTPNRTVVDEPPATTDEITCVDPPACAMFRIVDGAEEGSLLLAGLDEGYGDVYRLNSSREGLNLFLDGEKADPSALKDGMAILVTWSGGIMESFPAQLGNVSSIEAWSIGSVENPGGSYYDLCSLYLQVLNDLWEKDRALNEGKSMIGLDLSQAPGGLTDSEKSALAWRFGELHDVEVSLTTAEQMEAGTCLFSITPHEVDETETYSLPVLRFEAEKYVGPLAAYIFYDCSAVWPEFGTWSNYNIGSEMIA